MPVKRAALIDAVALAGLVAWTGDADFFSGFFSGDQLLAVCESTDPSERATCHRVIAGTSDMLGGDLRPWIGNTGFDRERQALPPPHL